MTVAKPRITINGVRNRMSEWSYLSAKSYTDPFNDVVLDVLLTGPDGAEQRVPAFWAGDQTWTVRYAPHTPGPYSFQTVCSDPHNPDLHGRSGKLEVTPYEGQNPLLKKGPIQVADDKRHFEYSDGTPFFWLGDTWWSGMAKRFRWPEDFRLLTADRVDKGFTVIQICAAFPPIMDGFDPRAANEAGFAWQEGYTRINPAYFDLADLRIMHLVEKGLVPCIIGAWGFNALVLGVEKMKQHFRYLVGRWGAYPVVWTLAGEGDMPWYLSADREGDQAELQNRWSEIGRNLKEIDPLWTARDDARFSARLLGPKNVADHTILDFDMLQTGHPTNTTIPHMIETVREAATREDPPMPVFNAEPSYEGVFGDSPASYQRFQFFANILSGAVAGYTYGAAGIWQFSTETEDAGKTPGGRGWATDPWTEAYRRPGSRQVGKLKAILMRYPWWEIEPHQEWVEPHWHGEKHPYPFAGGIPGKLRIFYLTANIGFYPKVAKYLEPDVAYTYFYLNPATGEELERGDVTPDADGTWNLPQEPLICDWVLVLEAKDA